MNAMLEQINSAGKVFVEFAWPMLAQSGVLIVILLLADFALRKKVRAVFRYWLWMLVLVKLILPTSLSSPVSLGHLFGDELANVRVSDTGSIAQPASLEEVPEQAFVKAGPGPVIVTSPMGNIELTGTATESIGPVGAEAMDESVPVAIEPMTWQGVVFLAWLAVVVAMGLLLLQRAIFVRGLVAQAREPNGIMNDVFEFCCGRMGLKDKVRLKVSENAASPAVCGLFRPVILVPRDLGPSLGSSHLRAVLLHELAHIKRGDLWVSLAQTILQIVYFYNPLLWLANAVIRRVREQAVDEMVQVAMGANAQQYPETLVNVAKIAFKRPVLSLRLIGVVESRNALRGRIKHMLDRPIPKRAKLGVVGLFLVVIAGVVLLPMAKAAGGRPEFIIKGTVTDAETGQLVAGAKVGDVERYAEGKQWTATDTDGNYSYLTWYEEHGIKCEASGYKTQNKSLLTKLLGSEKERVVDFALEPEEAARQTEFTATLANGVTVELVGVCDYPEGGKRCWRPDGSKSQKQIYATKWNKKNRQLDEFGVMFKLNGPEDLSFSWYKINGSDSYEGSCEVMDDQGNQLEGFEAAIALIENKPDTTSVKVGIAVGPWKTVAVHDGKEMCIKRGIAFSSAYEASDKVRIVVTDSLGREIVQRVVAIDNSGNIHPCRGPSGSVSNQNLRQTTANFQGLKLRKIKEFQFQTRPYEWVEFKNVSLKPNFKSDLQIEAQNPSGQVISASDFGEDEADVENRRAKLRADFENRMARDRAAYSDRELGEIEQLYQIANKKWKSQEAQDSLEKLVARYAEANRTGCAVLYLGQMSDGAQKARYLKRAIEDFGDCMYGDGVRVGAYARYQLGLYYQEIGKSKEAEGLFKEVREKYPDAIDHSGRLLGDSISAEEGKATKPTAGSAAPMVVSTTPPAFVEDVPPELDKIMVTFDRPMMDRSWSWTGGGETYPQTPGRPYYDSSRTTCTLPVKLEAGKVYWVGINSPSYKNFKTIRRIPAKRYVILFATRGVDGKPTPIPEDVLAEAKVINEQAGIGETKQINSSREQDNSAVSAGPADLQQLIDSARRGSAITIPKGVYTEPVTISKSLLLKGASRDDCIFEVTANEPAIFVDTKGEGKVAIEGITVKWQLATSGKKNEYPYAVAVKDSKAEVTNCSFVPLGNFKRCPTAIQAVGFSKLSINGCQFEGFEYTVCFGEGTDGVIEDCLISGSGHQGISLYSDARVRIERNVVTGSQYHGVRSTGGTLFMKDNLILSNANSGVYLGNKSAKGGISNNIIMGNGTGISGFAESKVKIANNIITDSSYAGIGMRSSCGLLIFDNIFQRNERGLILFKEEDGRDGNKAQRNTFWENKVDAENFARPADSILAEPAFRDPGNGDFSLTGGKPLEQKQGLTNPESLWKIWQRHADKDGPLSVAESAGASG